MSKIDWTADLGGWDNGVRVIHAGHIWIVSKLGENTWELRVIGKTILRLTSLHLTRRAARQAAEKLLEVIEDDSTPRHQTARRDERRAHQ